MPVTQNFDHIQKDIGAKMSQKLVKSSQKLGSEN